MQKIIEKLSRFNRIPPVWEAPKGTPIARMQWYGASPFVLGLRLDNTPWYPPQPQQDYLLFVLYGDLVITLSYYWSCEGISCKAGRLYEHLPPSNLPRLVCQSTRYTDCNTSVEEIFSFLDAIPNDIALCLYIPWAKPLIELACKSI